MWQNWASGLIYKERTICGKLGLRFIYQERTICCKAGPQDLPGENYKWQTWASKFTRRELYVANLGLRIPTPFF